MFGECDKFFERLDDFVKDISAYAQQNPVKREAGQQLVNRFFENKEQYDQSKKKHYSISIFDHHSNYSYCIYSLFFLHEKVPTLCMHSSCCMILFHQIKK